MITYKDYKKIDSDTKKFWKLNWDKIGKEEINEIFAYPRVKKLVDLYTGYINKNGLILEAGCGLSQWVGHLKSMGYSMVGIDYNAPTIMQAKEYNKDLCLAVADVKALPFKDNSIDTYLSFGVIEHFVEGPEAALRESFRTLKKGGTAIIMVPHKNIFIRIKSPIVWLKRIRLLRKIFRKENKVYYYQRYFSPKELRSKLLATGYKILLYKPVDHIFSLVEFSGIFRDKNTFDGENRLAVRLGNMLEKFFPHMCAGSNIFIVQK
jgi:ubiquinone/menaquinone biosynthesis C-methylase UbiE